jgi:hypothetical protein
MILLPALIVLAAVVVVGGLFIVVASVSRLISVRTSQHRSHRGLCPRCGQHIVEGNDHCTECGMIIPRKTERPAEAYGESAPSAGPAPLEPPPPEPAFIETVLPADSAAFDPELEEISPPALPAAAFIDDGILITERPTAGQLGSIFGNAVGRPATPGGSAAAAGALNQNRSLGQVGDETILGDGAISRERTPQ